MTITFRPATRPTTPLVVGLAGPTKSGKTYSGLLLGQGLAESSGKPLVVINAGEGAKGHQYANEFDYLTADLVPPYSPSRYTQHLKAALDVDPGCVMIDSATHMHEGTGGVLHMHETELDRMAGQDRAKREKLNFAAWAKPKQEESDFIYALLEAGCHIILCFRAKEKVSMKGGKVTDLGWQPIASDRLSFETAFTLMLPPRCKGVPDLSLSDLRSPFDTMIAKGQPVSADLGRKLDQWAQGDTTAKTISREQQNQLGAIIRDRGLTVEQAQQIVYDVAGVTASAQIPANLYGEVVSALGAAAPEEQVSLEDAA